MQYIVQKLKTNLFFFLELQFLISLVILPILIFWGLPISIMSIPGNLLFAYFLTIFIGLSALLFSTDLLGISNDFIAYMLESVTDIWYYLLSLSSHDWLIGFPLWMFSISLFLGILGCNLYRYKNITQNTRVLILATLFLANFCIKIIDSNSLKSILVMQGSQRMYLIKIHNKIYAFDCGALTARPSNQSWIEYTLSTNLIKEMGATKIDTLILSKSNTRTKDSLKSLSEHIKVNHIIFIKNF